MIEAAAHLGSRSHAEAIRRLVELGLRAGQ